MDISSKKVAISAFQTENTNAVLTAEWVAGDKWEIENAYLIQRFVFNFLTPLVRKTDSAVFIEEPVVARGNIRSTMKQAYVNGAVQAAVGLLNPDTSVSLVPVTTWKKEVVGKGNASKDEVADFVSDWMGGREDDQDICDAICVMLYGQIVMDRATRIESGEGFV